MPQRLSEWKFKVIKTSWVYGLIRGLPFFILFNILIGFVIYVFVILLLPWWLTVLMIILVIISVLVYMYSISRVNSQKIVLEPCKVQNLGTKNDVMPGKLVIEEGTITKHIQMITLERFDGTMVDKGIFGSFFNYGQIVLTDNGKPAFVIHGVISPEDYIIYIQETIDRMKGNVVELQRQQGASTSPINQT